MNLKETIENLKLIEVDCENGEWVDPSILKDVIAHAKYHIQNRAKWAQTWQESCKRLILSLVLSLLLILYLGLKISI